MYSFIALITEKNSQIDSIVAVLKTVRQDKAIADGTSRIDFGNEGIEGRAKLIEQPPCRLHRNTGLPCIEIVIEAMQRPVPEALQLPGRP